MPSASSGNLVVGLALPIILIVFALWSMRRSARKKPTFNPCPICNENIQFSLGFQRGMKGHFKADHPEYWRWVRKWIVITTALMLTSVISIFPLLYYNIIPARPTATNLTPIGIAIWASVTFSAMGAGILHQRRVRRRFKEDWSQNHPLYQRTYGNLRGVEVQFKEIHGKIRTVLGSGIEFLFNPVAPAALFVTNALIAKKLQRTKLDKYETGRLWFYNGFDMLASVDVKTIAPVIVDQQRIRIALKKGQLELKTENSADLNLIISVLNTTQTVPYA
jgi:hypothetical protein